MTATKPVNIQHQEDLQQGMKESALRMLVTGKYALDEIVNISGHSFEEADPLRAGKNI